MGHGQGAEGRQEPRKKSSQPPLAAALRWQRNDQHARKDARAGTYVLRTSHTDWDLERVARTYTRPPARQDPRRPRLGPAARLAWRFHASRQAVRRLPAGSTTRRAAAGQG